MIDLHCHMLPGIDDGPRNLETALRMAELALADGITLTACTPHINPGVFNNTHADIQRSVENFREELLKVGIPLEITYGADIQVVPDLVRGLDEGRLPRLHNSRYFLFEPPHHLALPRMPDLIHSALVSGYVPIITHPERLAYIENDYDIFIEAARAGAWIQLTGGSLLCRFGSRARQYAERFLRDGVTHLLASDGHNLKNRTPELADARDHAAKILGEEEAMRLVLGRPEMVLKNEDPTLDPPAGLSPGFDTQAVTSAAHRPWLARFFNLNRQH